MKPKELVESIVRALPMLPVLGFIFAICYESFFFWFLGVELRQVLTLSDIVEASALKILPAIPALLIAFWLGVPDPAQQSASKTEKPRESAYSPFIVVYFVFITAMATLYVLFGIHPWIGFSFLIFTVVSVAARFLLFPYIAIFPVGMFMAIWFLMMLLTVFAAMGQRDAHNVRFGDRSQLPLVATEDSGATLNADEYRLVRKLSSGLLVATNARDRLWLILNDSPSIVTFKTEPKPFRGLLCDEFDVCPSWAGRFHLNAP